MLRAAIFDVDGTLVDSVDLHARCWQEAFARYGKQLKFEEIRAQIGKGGDQLIPYFLDEEENERYGEELDSFRSELFEDKYLPRVRPFPGVRALFERVRRGGKRIALASSGKEHEIDHYVDELLGVRDLVDACTTSDDAEKSKPHPDIFAAAMRKVGVESAKEAVVLGDSPFDAEAAGRLTLPTIGLLCGGFSEAELRGAGCRWLFGSPADLLARFAESPLVSDERPTAASSHS
ncbi:MAG: HAD family hydrolase [Myxococcales bacterium]